MNNTSVSYRVEPHDLAGHRLRITLHIDRPAAEGQTLSLPAWIPGSYLIRDFSRQIESLTVRDAAGARPVRKLDNHTWQVAPGDGPVTVDYVVYAWDLSVRGAHVDQHHAFFNGTSVFLQVHGQSHQPCTVELVAPAGHADWKVYTSLPAAPGRAALKANGFGRYQAPDYDALIDHPVEMGTGQSVSFHAHGARHVMVFTDAPADLDIDRIAADVKSICETQIAFFDPHARRAPFLDSADRYVFMTQVTPAGYGGLEHRASTALMAARGDLPVRGQKDAGDGYRSFLGLVSHEYFHTWHVKRIKPAAFVPYDLTRPNLTRLLWVFEGFTSYYDDLFLLRAGLISETEYLRLLARTVSQVHGTPGRLKQSVAESSFDAWTRYYKQDENSPNALVSYYTKGSLVALGMDLMIRSESAGRASLDDVMHVLWTRYGKAFYMGQQTGVPEDAMADIVQEATGVDLRAFLTQYVDGCADVPLGDLLGAQGISLQWRAPTVPVIGARLRKTADGLVVASILEGGAAHEAGLSADDLIVAIDGIRVDAQPAFDAALIRAAASRRSLHIHVFRQSMLQDYVVRVDHTMHTECVLTRTESAPGPGNVPG